MADEENGDTNDEVEDKEDEASEKLMVIHANVVTFGLRFNLKTSIIWNCLFLEFWRVWE